MSFGADNSFLSKWVTRDLVVQGVALLLPGAALLAGYLWVAGIDRILWIINEFHIAAALQLIPFLLFFAVVKVKLARIDPLLLLKEL